MSLDSTQKGKNFLQGSKIFPLTSSTTLRREAKKSNGGVVSSLNVTIHLLAANSIVVLTEFDSQSGSPGYEMVL